METTYAENNANDFSEFVLGGRRDAVNHGVPSDNVVRRASTHPFAGIHKRPSYTKTQNLTGYGIEIFDDEQEDWDLVSTVSPNYLLVPNERVVELADEILNKSPFHWAPTKLFWDGKRFAYHFTATSDAAQRIVKPKHDAEVDDIVALGALFENSYDGSRAFRARIYAERLVCRNGMLSKVDFGSYRFRHTNEHEDWESDLRASLGLIQNAPGELERFMDGIDRLTHIGMTDSKMREVVDVLDLPTSRFGEVLERYYQHEEPTAYGVLNAVSYVTWHRNRSITDLKHNETNVSGLLSYAREYSN